MKVHTLTAIVGGLGCNASCPYCISHMTPTCGVSDYPGDGFDRRNFDVACMFAERNGVSTLLLTGKGEPTLYLEDIREYLLAATGKFPFIELQTNGIRICNYNGEESRTIPGSLLSDWYRLGMTTVSISIAHPDIEENARIFRPGNPYDFWKAVEKLHAHGFSVRINCTLLKGFVDTPQGVKDLRDKCAKYKVEQMTVREVAAPDDLTHGSWHEADSPVTRAFRAASDFSVKGLCDRTLMAAKAHVQEKCVELLELPHGGKVLDWNGQNVCLGNCMTETRDPEDIRQLIFFPDGHLRTSWQHEGAIIL